MTYSRKRPTRVWRTLEYVLYPVLCTLEYAPTKEECTLESKSCPESVAAPASVLRLSNQFPFIDWYDASRPNIPTDNNAFRIYTTVHENRTKRVLVVLQSYGVA